MNCAVYRLEGVSKVYGTREVCHVERLEIPRGSVMVLMGPNGAGKSTLLRLMAFLEPATSGQVIFEGHSCSDGKAPPLEVRRRVTMVFQTPTFFKGTVEQNVAYGLRFRNELNVRTRVRKMLESVGLSQLAKAKMTSVSTGEAQRVAIARALVFDPEVLLLDEPTANLDPQNVTLVEELIGRAVKERGTTVVLVTQNVFQAKRLAYQVGFMLNGVLVEVGPPDGISADFVDQRTRAVVRGEMIY